MTSPPCGPAPWDVIARARDRARPSSWRRTLLSAPGQPQGLHVDSDALLASFTGLDAQAAQWLKEQDVDVRELGLVCVHQPSQPFVDAFRARMDIDPAQIIPTFPHTGNAAAATRPSNSLKQSATAAWPPATPSPCSASRVEPAAR